MNVFFAKEGEKGLNVTSAAHLCALAAQVKDSNEKALENICFINTTINIIGAGDDKEMRVGSGVSSDGLNDILIALNSVSQMNAFISWFSEARKAWEEACKEIKNKSIFEWAKEQGITMPECPEDTARNVKQSDLQDIINEMDVKQRNLYLSLEAKSSVLGKFIHPGRPMEVARQKLHVAQAQPYKLEGNGANTTVKKFVPSTPVKEVDDLYTKLQGEYRATEQALNHIKGNLRKELDTRNLSEDQERKTLIEKYQEEMNKYHSAYKQLNNEFHYWQTLENSKIYNIKLVIPKELESIVDFLNNLNR
jgi:hypothetical protein